MMYPGSCLYHKMSKIKIDWVFRLFLLYEIFPQITRGSDSLGNVPWKGNESISLAIASGD